MDVQAEMMARAVHHPTTELTALGGDGVVHTHRKDPPVGQVLTDDPDRRLVDLGVVMAHPSHLGGSVLGIQDGLVDPSLGR